MGIPNKEKSAMSTHKERADKLSPVVKAALNKDLIHDDSPCIDLFDLDRLHARLKDIQDNLPGWNHAVAIKACPLSGVLRQAQQLGFGAECINGRGQTCPIVGL